MSSPSTFRTTAGFERVEIISPLTRRECLDVFRRRTDRKRPQYRTDPIVGWAIGNFIFATKRAASGGPLGRHLSLRLREQDGGTRAIGYIHWYPAVFLILAVLIVFIAVRLPLALVGIGLLVIFSIRPKVADHNDELVLFVSEIVTGRAEGAVTKPPIR